MYSAKFFKDLNDKERATLFRSALWSKIYSEYYFLESSVKYYSAYHNNIYKDGRLVIYYNEEPTLVLYSFYKENKLTYFQFPVSIFTICFDNNILNNSYKALFRALDTLLKKESINELFFYADPYLISEYFSALCSLQVRHFCIVDLTLSEENIKSNIRKSYKSLVNWGKSNLQTEVMNNKNADKNKFESFRKFHAEVAGRSTRNEETWNSQFEMIQTGEAYLVTAHLDSKLVSANLVLCGKEEAFYGVGVNDRTLMAENKPISHYPLLHSIFEAKRMGLKVFNMNDIDLNGADTKADNISKFKRGFSSTLRPAPIYTVKLNS